MKINPAPQELHPARQIEVRLAEGFLQPENMFRLQRETERRLEMQCRTGEEVSFQLIRFVFQNFFQFKNRSVLEVLYAIIAL
jgi:hypothetical protein